jgi:hypothetical protein
VDVPGVCVALPVVPSADAELAPDVAPVSVPAVAAPLAVRVRLLAVCLEAITWQLASISNPDIVCPVPVTPVDVV